MRGGSGGNSFAVNDSTGGTPTTLATGPTDSIDVSAAIGTLKVLDNAGSNQLVVNNAPHFQHIIGR